MWKVRIWNVMCNVNWIVKWIIHMHATWFLLFGRYMCYYCVVSSCISDVYVFVSLWKSFAERRPYSTACVFRELEYIQFASEEPTPLSQVFLFVSEMGPWRHEQASSRFELVFVQLFLGLRHDPKKVNSSLHLVPRQHKKMTVESELYTWFIAKPPYQQH